MNFALTTLELGFPAPPHDPRERELWSALPDWQIRAFSRKDRRYAYFLPRGFWHIQLWQPDFKVSILTPSRLTGFEYEVAPVEGWKARARDHSELMHLVSRICTTLPPSAKRLAFLERSFVHGELLRSAASGAFR